MTTEPLRAPFPYPGGKSRVAARIWQALGQPRHYLEPFLGSAAVLLARPNYDPARHTESVVDSDGFLCNVWRALQQAPDEVARWCDWPVNHADLTARKARLLANEAPLLENLTADDEWYDAKLAGYWVWAASCWIGSGLTRPGQIPHLGDAGMGVHALGQIPHLTNAGMGVHALGQIPHFTNAGKGVQEPYNEELYRWFRRLSERLRRVRVVCGDWSRVCGGDWQDKIGSVGIFFDPPYGSPLRDDDIYHHDSLAVAAEVAAWALGRGDNPNYRIVVAGYDDEHACLDRAGWRRESWAAQGGYSNTVRSGEETQGQRNRHRETLWFSPHCLNKRTLFDLAEEGS